MAIARIVTYGAGGWMPEIDGENILSVEEVEVPDQEDVLD